jgi:hypothetical protein
VLFHVTQVHDHTTCPVAAGEAVDVLFDQSVNGVTVRQALADAAAHTLYFVLEADDLEAVRRFLAPGAGRARAITVPVQELSELPRP